MKKVLVIDDEPAIRNVMAVHLKSASYEVTTAATGAEGIGLVMNEEYDLVLCDLNLADMSGIDVMKTIRTRITTMPILAISGFMSPDVIEEVESICNVTYLGKPFLKVELFEAIRKIFDNSVD